MGALERPSASDRVARLIEVVEVVRRLLAGETVTFDGAWIQARGAVLTSPKPQQRPVPLMVGGNNRALLRYAGAEADVISLSGLGRTLEDGHSHQPQWSPHAIDERLAIVRDGAAGRAVGPRLEALVQHVEITNDSESAAERLAARIPGLSPADVLACPFAMIGSVDQLADEARAHRARWGIGSYCVRTPFIDDVVALMEAVG